MILRHVSMLVPVAMLLLGLVPVPVAAIGNEPAEFLAIMESEGPRVVNLGSIDATGADLLDLEDGWMTFPPGECLAVIRRGAWSHRPARLRVVLHDGQTLTGVFLEGDDETVRIDHLWIRELSIPLERISRIDFRRGVVIPPGDADRVVLANGDLLEGFLERIGDPTVIEIGDSERIEVPLDRVAAVAIEGEPAEATWPQVWTIDGIRMSVDQASFTSAGRLDLARHEFMTSDYERFPGSDEIVALVFQGDRFTPLATMPVKTIKTAVARRTAPPPRREDPMAPVDLTDLHLRGPARFEFTLPPRAERLRTTLHRSRETTRWPSPTITISIGDREIWSGTAETDVPLDLSLAGVPGPLVIELACGDHGPLNCGVTLVEPIVSRSAPGKP